MNQDIPIIFANGTDFYTNLAKTHTTHPTGLFILAPSASGKTYYINNQKTNDWIDGDYLWPDSGADLSNDEWNVDMESVHEINRRCDVITYQAKKLGFWIIGSSNESLKPDAIVILPIEKHKEYILKREASSDNHGAKIENPEAVLSHREVIEMWKTHSVPCFDSIDEAVDHLIKK